MQITSVITSKGQVTLPKAVRDFLQSQAVECVVFQKAKDQGLLAFSFDKDVARKLGRINRED